MFTKARLILTFWYSLIILTISLFFSLTIFTLVNRDLNRISLSPFFGPYPAIIAEARLRLVYNLGFANLIILIVAATAGWFLAGRTLSPIQEMLDEQSRFIADASHELRTPITALRTQIEVNLRSPHLTLASAKDLLSSNLEEVVGLQSLTDSLIRLAQHQEKSNLQFASISTLDIVSPALKKISAQADGKHIRIVNQVKKYQLQADTKTLIEVIVILLDNAIKYSPEASTIILKSTRSPVGVSISITNSGPKIAKQDLPHLFDRFYRGDKSRNSAGFGLGLSIAKKIVDSHHGVITVKSSDQNTTFTVRIPTTLDPQIPS